MQSKGTIEIALRECAQIALAKTPQLFTTPIEKATPVNSSPYVLSLPDFVRQFAAPGIRAALLDRLGRTLDAMGRAGCPARYLLVGGSFINQTAEPRDLDLVVFYQRVPGAGDAGTFLLNLRDSLSKERLIDARFVALDGDPLWVIKLSAYFHALYQQAPPGVVSEGMRGSVLVTLPEQT